ncbi:oryzain alpha chain-like [Lolium rigidum]|uniref:oryzain alpha chain-like n=1 Tax=Lolium rigidum TaxID=89674 RepID=UPI001F5CA3D1|nr:oryzain alpha chain-like [Lolium rigidum]
MRFMAAATLLLLVSLAAAAAATTTSDSSGTPYRERSEEEMRRIFTEWRASYRKTDTSAAEEERRYALFCHYLQRIDLHWYNAGYPSWSWDRERSEEEAQRIFVEWKAKNSKTYSSVADEEHRYAMFKDVLREVDRHNVGYAFGVHDSIVGISNLADLTYEEIKVVKELRA